MILHTVNKSPYGTDTLESCLRIARQGDTVLLIEDAVYAALANGMFAKLLQGSDAKICVLDADLLARGLKGNLIGSLDTVDYKGFVQLTTTHDRVVSWF